MLRKIQAYVRRRGLEMDVVRLIGQQSKAKGTNKLTVSQIDKITKKVRSEKRHIDKGRKNTSTPMARLGPRHPLTGIWEQQPDPSGTTPVIYEISVRKNKFLVAALDPEDGIALKISHIKWDGSALRFTSLYPPTRHKAQHVLRALPNGRISRRISCVYADGETFSGLEVWRKQRERRNAPKSKSN